MKRYVVVGDVVDSRHVENRARFASLLNRSLAELNSKFKDQLHASFARLKGVDEIGGTLVSFKAGYRLVSFLEERLYPQKIRLAVCHGEVDIDRQGKSISTMDGPAFHGAAAELDALKHSPYLFSLQSGGPTDSIITALFNQLLLQADQWTPTQRKIAQSYRNHPRQKEVANKLRITQQSVSQALKSIEWYAFEESSKRLDEFLLKHIK